MPNDPFEQFIEFDKGVQFFYIKKVPDHLAAEWFTKGVLPKRNIIPSVLTLSIHIINA